MKGQRTVNTILTSCVAGLLNGCLGSSTPSDLARNDAPSVVVIDNAEIDEASGLAVSRRDANLLWLHNDSGGAASLFAIDTRGRGQRSVDIEGARNVDWEDLDAFTLDGVPRLLIADVGDNNAVRPAVQLYWVEEPVAETNVAAASVLTLVYPDGPRDVEGVAVDAAARQVYLLSKRDAPPRLYRVALDMSATTPVTAEYLGTVTSIPPPTTDDLQADPEFGQYRSQPTAMSVSADGRRIVVTTYKDSYLYRRSGDEAWIDALNRTPEVIDVPQFRQTEAAGVTVDGRTLFVASEQLPAPLARIELP